MSRFRNTLVALRGQFLPLCLLTAALLLVTSCQSGPEDDATQQDNEMCSVMLTVSNYQQISLDGLDGTRAVASDHPSTLAHLLVVAYDAKTGKPVYGPVVHHQADYTKDHENYPKFTLFLPWGNYNLLVLGYNGSKDCQLDDITRIAWTDKYVPHTFRYYEPLTVNGSVSISESITLRRCVAAFQLTPTDERPSNLHALRFRSTSGSSMLDATKGLAADNVGREYTIVVPADLDPSSYMFTVYFFLPENQITTDVSVEALDASNNVFFRRNFKDVPLRLNTLTAWEDELFVENETDVKASSEVSLYWDTKWENTIEYKP